MGLIKEDRLSSAPPRLSGESEKIIFNLSTPSVSTAAPLMTTTHGQNQETCSSKTTAQTGFHEVDSHFENQVNMLTTTTPGLLSACMSLTCFGPDGLKPLKSLTPYMFHIKLQPARTVAREFARPCDHSANHSCRRQTSHAYAIQ